MPKRISKTARDTAKQPQRLDAALHFALQPVEDTGAADAHFASIPVLPPSGMTGRDGRGPFTYDIARVTANVRANGADLPVFIDHMAMGEALGWLDHTAEPVQAEDGGWEWPVTYTDHGLYLLKTKAFRYNSPTFLFRQDPAVTDRQAGEIVGVLEVSFTNLPNLYMRSLNSAQAGDYTEYDINPDESENSVTPEQLEALGLAEGATDEQILSAITALKTAANTAGEKLAAITTAAGAEAGADATAVVEAAANSRVSAGLLVSKNAYDEVVTARDAALAEATTAKNALTAIQSAQSEANAVAAVDVAIKAGKYVPAAREALLKQARNDIETFNAVAAAMPAIAAVAANSVAGAAPAEAAPVDPAAEYSASVLGISTDVYAKGKATA